MISKKHYLERKRREQAIAEGRQPGRNGRPPLLEPDAVPILLAKIKTKILEGVQVNSDVILHLVCFLYF
jgi:hypothetical protein